MLRDLGAALIPGTPPQADKDEARPAKAPARPARYEQLDAFRLIVIAVITFHTYQHSVGPNGFVLPIGSPVDAVVSNLDFLLSFYFIMAGFGLAVQLFRPVLAGRALPTADTFISKRLARLVPLYLLVFLVVWELRYAGTTRQWGDFFWGITLMQSWSTKHIFATIDPAWYLSVEVAFVFVAALAMLPLRRAVSRWSSRRARLAALGATGVFFIAVGLVWKIALVRLDIPSDQWGRWFAPPAWMDLWGIGMLFGLAVMVWDRPDRWAPRGVPLALAAASLSWLWFLVLESELGELPRVIRFDAAALGLLGLMVASVLARPERRTRRVMASIPVQTLGAWSFGMFIVHAPLLRWLSGLDVLPLDSTAEWVASTLALLALSAVIGRFTLRYVEIPAQGLTRLHMPERSRRWHESKPIKPTLQVGDPCPPLLNEVFGTPNGPMVVLVSPAARMRPLMQGDASSIALYALHADRFIVESVGGTVNMIIGDDPDRIERVVASETAITIDVRGIDPALVATGVGVGGTKLRSGETAPSRVILVIDPDGRVAGILSGVNGETLARAAIELARDTARPSIVQGLPLRSVTQMD